MIWEELEEPLIFADLEADGRREVLEVLGGALIKAGYAENSYIGALIKREEAFPTGLDMGGIGIAIPHTDAGYIKKDGMAIARLRQPVSFLQMGTDSEEVFVRLVFVLAVSRSARQMEQLQQILGVIQDVCVLKRLLCAKNSREIIDIFREKERLL